MLSLMKTKDQTGLLEDGQLSKNDLEALRAISEESEYRLARRTKVATYDYRASDSSSPYQLAVEGTCALYVGYRDSKIMQRLKKALMGGTADDLRLGEELARRHANDQRLSLPEAVAVLRKQDVFADLSYGGRLLHYNATVLNKEDLFCVGLPYNGGSIERDCFEFIEHYVEGSTAQLEAAIIVAKPSLTEEEVKALEAVSHHDRWYNIGKAHLCFAVSAVTLTMAACAVSLCCINSTLAKKGYTQRHLSDAEIKKMGAAKTAKELLKMRRELLIGKVTVV